ncbi:LysM domain [Seminavis robusta]|uniref:LysM domain n=1 Tax=Seminavis robusta TaxID=568900 RepID=A0A9N8DFE1_9STRA|nr:LysM domain [Seminavis robusta]|eukprot:Sro131_g062190.1 LysM domain (386) ;mRNA; r:30594-31828
MGQGLSGLLAKAEVKVLECLEKIDLNVLGKLERFVGVESGAVNAVGMQSEAVKMHATANASVKVLEKCKRMGIIENGAIKGIDRGAFDIDMFNTLEKIVGLDASALERIVGMDLRSLQKLMDCRNNQVYGARLLERVTQFLPSLKKVFTSTSVTVSFGSGGIFVLHSFVQNMESEDKANIFGHAVYGSLLLLVAFSIVVAIACTIIFVPNKSLPAAPAKSVPVTKTSPENATSLPVGQPLNIPNASTCPAAGRTHIVQQGETLYSIAEQYYGAGNLYTLIQEANGLSPENEANGLSPENVTSLPVGQPLNIPNASSACPATGRTHIVQQGETLYSIAEQYYGAGNLYTLIQEANGLSPENVTSLRVGQSLVIRSYSRSEARFNSN